MPVNERQAWLTRVLSGFQHDHPTRNSREHSGRSGLQDACIGHSRRFECDEDPRRSDGHISSEHICCGTFLYAAVPLELGELGQLPGFETILGLLGDQHSTYYSNIGSMVHLDTDPVTQKS